MAISRKKPQKKKAAIKYRTVNGQKIPDYSGLGLKKTASGVKKVASAYKKGIKTTVKAVKKVAKKVGTRAKHVATTPLSELRKEKAAKKAKRVRTAAIDSALGTGVVRAIAKAAKNPAKVKGRSGAKRRKSNG